MPGLGEIIRSDRTIQTDSSIYLSDETLFNGLYSLRPDTRMRAIYELKNRESELRPRTARRLAKLAVQGIRFDIRENAAECLARHPSRDSLPILLEALGRPETRSQIFEGRAEFAAIALKGSPFDEAVPQLYANAIGPRRQNPKSGNCIDAICAKVLSTCENLGQISEPALEMLKKQVKVIRDAFFLDNCHGNKGNGGTSLSENYRLALNLLSIFSGRQEDGFRSAMLEVLVEHEGRIFSRGSSLSWHSQEPALCQACIRGLNLNRYDGTAERMLLKVIDLETPTSVRTLLAQALSGNADDRVQARLRELAVSPSSSRELRAAAAYGLLS